MKNIYVLSLVLLFLFTATACTRWQALPLASGQLVRGTSYGPARMESKVTVFMDKSELPEQFTRVGIITTTKGIYRLEAADWWRARRFAAQMGANGVYLKAPERNGIQLTAVDSLQRAGAGTFSLNSNLGNATFIAIEY